MPGRPVLAAVTLLSAWATGASAQPIRAETGMTTLRDGMFPDWVSVRTDATVEMIGGAIVGAETFAHRGEVHRGMAAATFDSARFIVRGGIVRRNVSSHDFSSVAVNGGYVELAAFGHDASTVVLAGGQVRGGVYCYDNATLRLTGGTVLYVVQAAERSSVEMSGGLVDGYVSLADEASMTMSGGGVDVMIFLTDRASLSIDAAAFARDEDGDPQTPATAVLVDAGESLQLPPSSPMFALSDHTAALRGLRVEWADGRRASLSIIASRRADEAWEGRVTLRAIARTRPEARGEEAGQPVPPEEPVKAGDAGAGGQ